MRRWIYHSGNPSAVRHLWRMVDLDALSGTEFPEPGPADAGKRLREVLRALAARRLDYGWEPADEPEPGAQAVRTPQDILERGQHPTCIDLSLLAAACLLRAGIHPFIVVGGGADIGHAWVVADLGSERTKFPSGVRGSRNEQAFPAWERQIRVETPDRPIENGYALWVLLDERERFVSIDVARLACGYAKDGPSDTERVERSLAAGPGLFDDYTKLEVCDVGWWWNGTWVLASPDQGSRSRRGSARSGRPLGSFEERPATVGTQPDRTVLIADDEDAEAIADVLPGWNRLLTWDSTGANRLLDDTDRRIDVAIVDMMLDEDHGSSGRRVAAHSNRVRPLLPKISASKNHRLGDYERTQERAMRNNAVVSLFHKPDRGASDDLAALVAAAARVPRTELASAQVDRLAFEALNRAGQARPDLFDPPGAASIEQARQAACREIDDLDVDEEDEVAALLDILQRLATTLEELAPPI